MYLLGHSSCSRFRSAVGFTIATNGSQRRTQVTTDSFPQHLSDMGKVCLGGFFSRKANACPLILIVVRSARRGRLFKLAT